METPPGGNRGSMAVFVEFLLVEPPVIVLLAAFVSEADSEPDADADSEADALSVLFSSSLSSEL